MRRVREGGQEPPGVPQRGSIRSRSLEATAGKSTCPWHTHCLGPLSPGWRAIGYREGRGQEGRHWRQRENGPKLGTGMKPGTGRKEGMSFTQGHCDCPGQSEHLNPGLSWGEGGRLASPEVGLDYRIGRHIPMLACHF